MGRWQIDPASGQVGANWTSGFAFCRTGGAGAMVPRGLWTYGQRMFKGNNGYLTEKRPLAAFRDGAIFTSTDDLSSLCRVDFTPESIAAFDGTWHTHRHELPIVRDKKPGRTDYWLLRLHEDPSNATWTAAEVFGAGAYDPHRIGGAGR